MLSTFLKENIDLKLSYLIIVVITILGNLFCEEELLQIKSPHKNLEDNVDVKIMDLVYPQSAIIPMINTEFNDSLKFLIPSNEILKSYDFNLQQIISFNLNNLENNKVYSFANYNKLSYFKSSDFLYIDIDNDNTPEVFCKAEAPWGGGGEYCTIYWKKDKNYYRLENAFWGTIERIITANNTVGTLITKYKSLTSWKIYEISMPSYNIIKNIFYSRINIPLETDGMNGKKFHTINPPVLLRVWPERIDSGFFDPLIQDRNNGNVQAIIKSKCTGLAYCKFVDSNNKIWYLVIIQVNQLPIWHTFRNIEGNGEHLIGWLNEEFIRFDE